jgi:hypothetical protein
MNDSLLLGEVAKLHQRDVEKEITLSQLAKQADKPGLTKRFGNVSVSVQKKLVMWLKRENLQPDEQLFLNTNV